MNGVAFGGGAVWATNEIADEVYRIDPRTNEARVVARTASPRGVGAGEGAAWVVAASPPSRDAALPSPVCGEVFRAGTDAPRFLIVSDLPLQGESRPITQAIVDGMRHFLEQRGFEAGGYTVGFQSCDASTAQAGGSDFFRCGSNAKAYARNLSVVGVVGSFQSPCSYLQIPVTNEAVEGPLAMLSPSNTYQELTENEELYPSGVRNYVRIAGADHLQAIAHAQLAKSLGAQRVAVLSARGDDYFGRFAEDVGTAGRQLGLDVVSLRYDNEARDFGAVRAGGRPRSPRRGRRRGHPLPGVRCTHPRGARRRRPEGRDPRPRRLRPVRRPRRSGRARREGDVREPVRRRQLGVAATRTGVPRELRAIEALGRGPDFAAAYGAQAAEILLDAIARSDGTRASVTREVFRARVEDGILGDIRFDRNGDLVDAPFTFFRIVGERSSEEGLHPTVDRVVVARSALLRAAG